MSIRSSPASTRRRRPVSRCSTSKYYNPYFEGWNISMPPPLTDGAVTYSDGTKATVEQEAHDVVTFLAWASRTQDGRAQTARLRRDWYLPAVCCPGCCSSPIARSGKRPALRLSALDFAWPSFTTKCAGTFAPRLAATFAP